MKCLSAVALFCLIAIASAGIQAGGANGQLLHRLKRQGVQSFSTSSSSSSSSTQQGNGPIVFQQTSSSFNSFAPTGGNIGSSSTNVASPDLLQDRFGPDDNSGNNQAFTNQAFAGQAFSGQAFPGQAYPGQAFSGQAYPGQVFGGHFSSVSGHYDPNTQQTYIHQNINQKI